MKRRGEAERVVAAGRDRDKPVGGEVGGGEPKKVRRQVERICESIGVNFDDLAVLRIEPDAIWAISYRKDENGALFQGLDGKPATEVRSFPVDMTTFVGDEGDV